MTPAALSIAETQTLIEPVAESVYPAPALGYLRVLFRVIAAQATSLTAKQRVELIEPRACAKSAEMERRCVRASGAESCGGEEE